MDYTMDIFIEHRVVRKSTGLDKLKIAGLTVAGILLFFVLLGLGGAVLKGTFFVFFFALDIGLVYLWWILVSSFNVEYEYALTNGEMDIDKIIAKRKRKRLITVNMRNIEVFAPVHSPDHRREFENPNFRTKIDASSSPDSDGAYFLTVNTEKTGFTRVILEPNQKILDNVSKLAPRKVFIK